MEESSMSGTLRAGLIFGALAFFSNVAVGMLGLNILAPLLGVIWGVAAGIASINWTETIAEDRSASGIGARAGAIAGVGAFLGLAVGMTIWFSIMGGQETSIDLTQTFADEQGLELPSSAYMQELSRYSLVVATCCFGAVSVAVLSATGAVGAYFYDASQNELG
jgi:hypothetical protein